MMLRGDNATTLIMVDGQIDRVLCYSDMSLCCYDTGSYNTRVSLCFSKLIGR